MVVFSVTEVEVPVHFLVQFSRFFYVALLEEVAGFSFEAFDDGKFIDNLVFVEVLAGFVAKESYSEFDYISLFDFILIEEV